MSCPRLSRRSLHLVLGTDRSPYELASMDISRLFYPLREEEKAAATKPNEVGSFLGGRRGTLPEPRIHYSPLRDPGSVITISERLKDAFALFEDSKIVCSDAGGFATMYNTESHFMSLPEMNSPKGPVYIVVSIPRTAAHAMADFEIHPDVDSAMFGDKMLGNHTHSLYIMDMVPDKACSFEALVYYPASRWCWRPLPPPPFHEDPKYRTPEYIPFALVGDGTKICVSSDRATYSFDTVAMEWSKAGDWVLPFLSKLEYDTGLKMWFGMSARTPWELCAIDLSDVALGSCEKLPTVQRVGLEVDLPQNWNLIDASLVNFVL